MSRVERLQESAPKLLNIVEAYVEGLDANAMHDYGFDIRDEEHPWHDEWKDATDLLAYIEKGGGQ